MNERSKAIIEWYENHARALLNEHHPGRVEEFDRERRQIELLATKAAEPVSVCFLGNAAVGKSTLLNALVSGVQTLVPAGGVGPLTAQATSVEFAPVPFFEATYQHEKKLWELGFALERLHVLRSGREDASTTLENEYRRKVDADSLEHLKQESDDSVEAGEGGGEERVKRSSGQKLLEWEKQARLLVTDNQDSARELSYLVDALRLAMGMQPRWGSVLEEADRERVTRIAKALEFAEHKRPMMADGGSTSTEELIAGLRVHASGSLAPLIARLRVGWPAELLKGGLTLVDLPGVGIASDVHKEVTHAWINGNTRALVLVVDRAGVSESCTRLLSESGFLQRLLTAADDPQSDPIALFVAVTRVDDVARTRRNESRATGKLLREHFVDVADELIPRIQGQLRQQLSAIELSSHQLTQEAQQGVITRVLRELQVFPVSATELQKLCAGDEEDRPFLLDEESTNIPALRRALSDQAGQWKAAASGRESEAAENVFDRLQALLQVTLAQWHDSGRAEEEADRLRRALDDYAAPIREELATRKGEFRQFLKNMGDETISLLVEEALTAARTDMRKHVRPFREYHFKTLQAAVRRGGVWDGVRTINLPDKFTDACEQPITAIWGQKILSRLRSETRDLANDYAKLVERVADWAGAQGANVQADLVRQQRDAIRAEAKALERVGREIVDELREKVRKELHNTIAGVIGRGCDEFCKENRDRGRGVRNDMVELCDGLVDKVANGVRVRAQARLSANFQEVEAQIRSCLKQMEDPIGAACDAIVERHEQRHRRSDAQKKKKVVKALEEALAARPVVGSFDFGSDELI